MIINIPSFLKWSNGDIMRIVSNNMIKFFTLALNEYKNNNIIEFDNLKVAYEEFTKDKSGKSINKYLIKNKNYSFNDIVNTYYDSNSIIKHYCVMLITYEVDAVASNSNYKRVEATLKWLKNNGVKVENKDIFKRYAREKFSIILKNTTYNVRADISRIYYITLSIVYTLFSVAYNILIEFSIPITCIAILNSVILLCTVKKVG